MYNFENLYNIPESEMQFLINHQLFLDTLLMEIRGQTIPYSSYKKKQNDKTEMQLADEILKLEKTCKGFLEKNNNKCPPTIPPELSFLYATSHLVLFYICTKHHQNIP